MRTPLWQMLLVSKKQLPAYTHFSLVRAQKWLTTGRLPEHTVGLIFLIVRSGGSLHILSRKNAWIVTYRGKETHPCSSDYIPREKDHRFLTALHTCEGRKTFVKGREKSVLCTSYENHFNFEIGIFKTWFQGTGYQGPLAEQRYMCSATCANSELVKTEHKKSFPSY